MISVSGKRWIEHKINKNLKDKIKQEYNFNEIISRLIVSRNFNIAEINCINNNLKIINKFDGSSDFEKASNILIDSINKKEKICILGDYDVDGISATSLLVRYFNHIKQKHFYYIPNRQSDGYGASKVLFQKLILQKPKLVIMVDCGSTSNLAVNFLNQNNIKSIIIDHHEIYNPYPKSDVIINPKKKIDYSKYNYLCATTLTYFFIDIIIKKTKSNFKLSKFLIYVLLATVCDVMPLRKMNKLLASNVIKNFHINENLAFKIIYDQFNFKNKLTIEDLGFYIGPIINSGGRLGYSRIGAELLTSDEPEIIKKKALQLIKLNEKRKQLEKKFLNEIDFKKIKNENKNVVIYINYNLHEGLIGILASRLKDYFNKPSIVITKSDNILKASARSTVNYNIGKLVKLLIDKEIVESGGGHNMAAGFSIKKSNVKLLDDYIQKDYLINNKDLDFSFKYDAEISASSANINLYNEIIKLGPFGNGNHSPIFLIRNVKILKSNLVGENHVSSIIKPKNGTTFKTICFNSFNSEIGTYLLSYKKQVNIIAELTKNSWNNKNSTQLNIKDLFVSANSA
tara:strand:- start:75 stop:1784 length:1710 start_codon:yes stop_codon:yes gene_type:complete